MLSNNKTDYRTARDIANRSNYGIYFYLVIFSIIVVFTPYFKDYPALLSVTGLIILISTIVRIICVVFFERLYKYNKKKWEILFDVSTLMLSGAWGTITMFSIIFYGWQWTTMLTCLSASAFAAGAVTTFSINYRLIFWYGLLMFVPTIITTTYIGTRESLTATFLFLSYLIFLLQIAKRLSNEYWKAYANTRLLDERARELEAKNRELEAFAYSVSHDLRAPLRSMDGFSKILLEDASAKLNQNEQQYLNKIRIAAQRMGQLIDDLLQLSRITRVKFNRERVNLSLLVQSNIDKLKQLDPNRNVDVVIEPDIETEGDKSLLDVALDKLINNAWKYTSKNNYSKIKFGSTMQDGQLVYYVKDNGVGFDTRYSDKLFGAFQRLHHYNEYPGTGIGLATVARIMQRHGGQVWANAKVDRGATFYFTVQRSM